MFVILSLNIVRHLHRRPSLVLAPFYSLFLLFRYISVSFILLLLSLNHTSRGQQRRLIPESPTVHIQGCLHEVVLVSHQIIS